MAKEREILREPKSQGDLDHQLFKLLLDDRLFISPLSSPQYVLDLAARNGDWALDVADTYPTATVTAIEAITISNQSFPKNLRFYQDNVEDEWIHPRNAFDLIHFSLQSDRMHDYSTLLEKAFRSLKPGGYVEIYEVEPGVHFANGQTGHDTSTFLWHNLYEQAYVNGGFPLITLAGLQERLKKLGFVNIRAEVLEKPCSPWSSDLKARRIGQISQDILMSSLRAKSFPKFRRFLGLAPDEIEAFLQRFETEICDANIKSYQKHFALSAQKPL